MYSFIKISLFLLLLHVSMVSADNNTEYAYPIKNPYAATVFGTPVKYQADLPEYYRVPYKEYTLKLADARPIPDVFWYDRWGLKYALVEQNKKAPLIIAIAGTGSGHRSAKMRLFQRAFYQAGFHVLTLSSPTFTNFMVNASQSAIPGNLEEDSADLYKVIQLIIKQHPDLEVSDYHLIGYSLGASQAAFVARLDDQEKHVGFKKVLMINPPLNLLNSVSLMDNLLTENIPGGIDNFSEFFKNFMKTITSYYQERGKLSLTGPDFFYAAYADKEVNESQLKALIGIAFRMASSDMIFVTDVFNNLGFLVPKNTRLTATSSLTEYAKASRRLGFNNYVEEIYFPYFTNKTGISRMELTAQSSLLSIKDYLQHTDKIAVMHNQNDPILQEGEIEIIKTLFPGRAMIYPYGGHCGNMAYKDNVAYMVDFFTGGKH